MIGRLGYGELRLVVKGQTQRYYVDGGFVQVADDVVSVLTNRAMPAAADRCQLWLPKQLAAAQSRQANSEELLADSGSAWSNRLAHNCASPVTPASAQRRCARLASKADYLRHATHRTHAQPFRDAVRPIEVIAAR